MGNEVYSAVMAVGLGVLVGLVLSGSIAAAASALVTLGIWTLCTLVTGRTPGDLAVEVRFTGGPLPAPVARTARFVGGIGGYLLLGLLPGGWSVLAAVFAVASAVLAFTTTSGRGLPGLVSGQRVDDARTLVQQADQRSE